MYDGADDLANSDGNTLGDLTESSNGYLDAGSGNPASETSAIDTMSHSPTGNDDLDSEFIKIMDRQPQLKVETKKDASIAKNVEKGDSDRNPLNNKDETDNKNTTDSDDDDLTKERSVGYVEVHHSKAGDNDCTKDKDNPRCGKKPFAVTSDFSEYYRNFIRQLAIPRMPAEALPHYVAMSDAGLSQRQIRQNPNLTKQKNLLEPDIEKLKTGLELGYNGDDDGVRLSDTDGDTIYDLTFFAAVGAAFILATVGLILGWYALTRKVKAAADVDYPAYGVTGPSVDTSGDRKLAHSAHIYHYQHQKQQIIAMERCGLEPRVGSMSDIDSEEENEEGDYTVYECPGLATTGAMEVNNPLFSEEPTPDTSGNSQVEEAQPEK